MKINQNNYIGRDAKNQNRGAVKFKSAATTKHGPFAFKATFNTLAIAITLNLTGSNLASAADIPSSLPPSETFGAQPFSQQMIRFEEFGVRPIPDPATTVPKNFPLPEATLLDPGGCTTRPDAISMDSFLDLPLWPEPTAQANDGDENPWHTHIAPCQGFDPQTFTGVMEGRPPGVSFSHQRWDEFNPVIYFETAMGGARAGTGLRDDEQSHTYSVGEFAPGGLYHNVTGTPGLVGTSAGINIRFHPLMPIQEANTLWTFGDGTLPPKLLRTRYAQPILMRHHNALPIDAAANGGFGEHTITTHEHNGHNPGEVDGFAGAYFFPGQYYDYRWPMVLAGYDSINVDALDPRASTPCSLGETLQIADPVTHLPVAKLCDPDTLTVNIAGDWRETMSTHWFHDHMIDRTSENVYKGNAAMMNYYSGIDRGKEGFLCDYDDTPTQDNVNLCFPSGTALDWGNRDYDVQLLIAAKAWHPTTGQLDMAGGLNEDGFLGDMMTVNWLFEPYMEVRPRKYRFRILNGAVARFFKFVIVEQVAGNGGEFPGPGVNPTVSYNQVPMHMIANDGNIMEHAVPFPNALSPEGLPVQSIAERFDVIVDFSPFTPGSKLYMVNTLAFDDGRGPDAVIPLAEILDGTYAAVIDPARPECISTPTTPATGTNCWIDDPAVKRFMEFRVAAPANPAVADLSMNPADYEVGGKTMIPLVQFTQAELDGAIHRTFDFGRGGFPGLTTDSRPAPWGIVTDGELIDPLLAVTDPNYCGPLADPNEPDCSRNADLNRVSAAPETIGGGVEIWHITGGGGWGHPVHIHFEEGQYLDRDGAVPPPWEVGARKDMYRISNLDDPSASRSISVAIRFREFAGTYVEHCHNTTHEDKAMLLRWDNELPGQTVRIPTPLPTWDGVNYISVATPYQKVVDAVLDPVTGEPIAPIFADVTEVETSATAKTGNVTDPELLLLNTDVTTDAPGDTILDVADNCIMVTNEDQADGDGDGVGDACDNCTLIANADQRDTNADGFGNVCDVDLTSDLAVDLTDFSTFRSLFGGPAHLGPVHPGHDADFDGNGVVDLSDFSTFRGGFGGTPGPSGLDPQ